MTVNKTERFETKYGIRSFDSLESALNEKPDAVFVTNPNSLHLLWRWRRRGKAVTHSSKNPFRILCKTIS
jgi:hypothetical protein